MAGVSGKRLELIHRYGVDDKRRTMAPCRKFKCERTSKVRSMLTLDIQFCIRQHSLGDSIGSACQRTKQTAACHNSIETHRSCLNPLLTNAQPIWELIPDTFVVLEDRDIMPERFTLAYRLTVGERDFG